MCEKSVKIGHFSHVFHMVFHIHTPSSVCRELKVEVEVIFSVVHVFILSFYLKTCDYNIGFCYF